MKIFFQFICLSALFALTFTPAEAAKTVGNPNAPQGGTLKVNLGAEPSTLNPITAQDGYSGQVHGYVLDSLFSRNVDTYEFEPSIAESMELSKDKKVFTVKIKKGLVFSDGKPLTAEDVKFSFDVIFDDTYNAIHYRSYYEGIEKVEIVDPHTVKFYTKTPYFKNEEIVSGLSVLPKHIYGNAEKGKKMNKSVIGSGPYVIDKYQKGKRLVLKRNPKWWGNNDPAMKGNYNAEEIILRFIKEEQIEIERLRKGDLDYAFFTPEQYVKKTTGPDWKKEIDKHKVQNKGSKGYGFIGWNLQIPIFQSKKTRQALAHLMNRKLMIDKFLFNLSEEATGPWYRDSIYASPKVKPLSFDRKKAQQLLKADGWSDSDKNGILDKKIDGNKVEFRFSLLTANKDFEKYLTIYKEDLRRAGIDMEIKVLEWNAFVKLLDSKKFQAVNLGWGGGSIDLDPKQIWHSDSAGKGGSNFISYSNKEVDELIEKARTQFDRNDRIKTLQKVYELIADDAPYLFLFNRKYSLYGTRKRIGIPKDTYKFAVGTTYWWIK